MLDETREAIMDVDESRIQAAVERGVRRALGQEDLSDEELSQKFMNELSDQLMEVGPELDSRLELDERDLDVDYWVVVDVHDAEGNEVFHEGG